MPYYVMKEVKWNPLRLFGIRFYKDEGHLFLKVGNRRRRKLR